MMGDNEQRSEVARLLGQITQEYEAAQRGFVWLEPGDCPTRVYHNPYGKYGKYTRAVG